MKTSRKGELVDLKSLILCLVSYGFTVTGPLFIKDVSWRLDVTPIETSGNMMTKIIAVTIQTFEGETTDSGSLGKDETRKYAGCGIWPLAEPRPPSPLKRENIKLHGELCWYIPKK